jgi:16S rRNA (cytosine1402-N4)-methyltransferase
MFTRRSITALPETDLHIPVMLQEVKALLEPVPCGVLLDGTVGGGGHAAALLTVRPDCRLVGLDRDAEVLPVADERLGGFGTRVRLEHGDYREFRSLLGARDAASLSGVFLDLGLSSFQLDDPGRGFSFSGNAPLDMRFDRSRGLTAAELLTTAGEAELSKLFHEFGEVFFARRLARLIVREREKTPVESTGRLLDLVRWAAGPRRWKGPLERLAAPVFQALRLAVNRELEGLEQCLEEMIETLVPGGRIAVIAFHSLEDRIVKQTFRRLEKGCICPPDLFECVCGRAPSVRILTRKPLRPTEEEVRANPRARSARLRVAERPPQRSP